MIEGLDELAEAPLETIEFARVELMGHRQRVGQIQEVTRFGYSLLRVDFWDAQTNAPATEYYNGSAIYCLSPVSKAVVEAYEEQQKRYRQPSTRQLPPPEDDPLDDDDGARIDFGDPDSGDDEERPSIVDYSGRGSTEAL